MADDHIQSGRKGLEQKLGTTLPAGNPREEEPIPGPSEEILFKSLESFPYLVETDSFRRRLAAEGMYLTQGEGLTLFQESLRTDRSASINVRSSGERYILTYGVFENDGSVLAEGRTKEQDYHNIIRLFKHVLCTTIPQYLEGWTTDPEIKRSFNARRVSGVKKRRQRREIEQVYLEDLTRFRLQYNPRV